jgi:Carbohydrate binding module (family 6)
MRAKTCLKSATMSAALLFCLASVANAAEGPFGGTPAAVPGTVMAENYDTGGQGVGYNVTAVHGTDNGYRSDGVDLEKASAPATGNNLGWAAAGQWFRYTVNVSTAGTYKITFLVAAESAIGDAFHLSNSSGTNLSGSVAVPDTGLWQTWTTVTATVTLPAGVQTLTLNEDAAGWNIDSMVFASTSSGEGPFGGTPAAIPGTVLAEKYDTGGQGVGYNVTTVNGTDNAFRSDGVDLETTSAPGGGNDIGWTAVGQWFRYTVNVATAGTYTVTFEVAAPSAVTDAFHLSNSSGTNLSGSINIPATGGFQTWTTVTATVTLPAGMQTLTLNEDNAGWNIYSMAFTSGGGGTGSSTAWQNGIFNVNTADVVGQSDIILQAANSSAFQAMPLGNGNLGAAIWSASGMTIQLNRNDTFPSRKSLGWVTIPGLSALTGGSGYSGKVDLYNGQFVESGGGMTATVFVRTDKDEIVIDVTGANPSTQQTAQIHLWSGRSPTASASGTIATLAESWVDNNTAEVSSGLSFGSLAGITAGGQNVVASVVNSTTVQVSFKPNADGTFRIVIGGPTYNGSQNAMNTVTSLIGGDATAAAGSLQSATTAWWNNFWAKTGLIHMTSSDGGGAYVENIRDVNLFLQAASSSGQYPGHHAGLADMFNFAQDTMQWDPELFWHWNLRMFIGSNMAAGHPELNAPYFNLYTSNLSNLEAWTKQVFAAGNGSNICIPEETRFNGNGSGGGNESCWPSFSPLWNALTLSSGAEVSNWIWQQYLYTNDTSFLRTNFPTMAASASFLLDYATTKSDGLLHMTPTNTHEEQWGIDDSSINDVAAMKTIFPETIAAAQLLGTDASLVTQLQAAIPKIQDYPRTDTATQSQLLTASSDAGAADMLGLSYVPAAQRHNGENDYLEPVWPYGLIGDNSTLTALALRTFKHRSYVNAGDWSFDSVQAARLGDAADFATAIASFIGQYQTFPSGIGYINGGTNTSAFYDEMAGCVTTAVQEALVQDYDGLLRIAPAWPFNTWNVSGTVYIQGNSKVDVQIEGGQLITAVLEAASTQNYLTRNPWGTQNVQVVDGSSGAVVVAATTASTFTIPAQSGHAYVIELVSSPTTALPYAEVTASPASVPRSMWGRTIGIP